MHPYARLLPRLLILIALTLAGRVAHAQEPATSRPPITAQNAAQVVLLMNFDLGPISGGGAVVSPDGTRLAMVSEGNVVLVDLLTGEKSAGLFSQPVLRRQTYKFSPDGRLLAFYVPSGSGTRLEFSYLQVIDAATHEERLLLEVDGIADDLEFSPNGTWLAVTAVDCLSPETCSSSVKILEVATMTELVSLDLPGYVSDTRFSPDSTTLAFATSQRTITDNTRLFGDAEVHLFNVTDQQDRVLATHDEAIFGPLFFSADGRQLAYSTVTPARNACNMLQNGALNRVDIETGEAQSRLAGGGLLQVLSPDWHLAYFSPNFVFPGTTGEFCGGGALLNVETGEDLSAQFGTGTPYFSVDGTLLALPVSTTPPSISLRDSSTGLELNALRVEGADSLARMTFSPDGTLLVASYYVEGNLFIAVWGIP